MHWTVASPSLGVYVTSSSRGVEPKWRRSRYATKSAPAHTRHRRPQIDLRVCNGTGGNHQHQARAPSLSATHQRQARPSTSNKISIEDVFSFAEHTREMTTLENRRHVLEEAQRAVLHEALTLDLSRPQSGVAIGLQALTSPMPISARDSKSNHMDHIPALLPLPSDRTFVPSPDQDHNRHMTTPVEDMVGGETNQSVARQCCEIMGASRCRTCRKLESRMLNREKADRECPRMRLSHQNISMTQVVKRFYPHLSEAEIRSKIARGEIARSRFPYNHRFCQYGREMDEEASDEEEEVRDKTSSVSESESTTKTKIENKNSSSPPEITPANPIYLLAKLSMKLKGEPTTPLFFTNLRRMQSKILSGEVERKTYMNKPKVDQPHRLKSAVSTISNSSGKSTLSKVGAKLSEALMPVFVSPRKVKIIEEPKYKVFYEPPLLEKRKQIPNPSFFAGSDSEYSLPERLPDIIEFADSQKILAMEKLARSTSSMSFASNVSEDMLDPDRLASSMEKSSARSDRPLSGQAGEGNVTPRLMRVSTEGALGAKVVKEEDELKHVEEENNSQNVFHEGEKQSCVEENVDVKNKISHESTQQQQQVAESEDKNIDEKNAEAQALSATENSGVNVSFFVTNKESDESGTHITDNVFQENHDDGVTAENLNLENEVNNNIENGDRISETMANRINNWNEEDNENIHKDSNKINSEEQGVGISGEEKDAVSAQEGGEEEGEEGEEEEEEFEEIEGISYDEESEEGENGDVVGSGSEYTDTEPDITDNTGV